MFLKHRILFVHLPPFNQFDSSRYLTRDTLAAQVVYPLTQSLAEGELLALLQMVKLDYLITGNSTLFFKIMTTC